MTNGELRHVRWTAGIIGFAIGVGTMLLLIVLFLIYAGLFHFDDNKDRIAPQFPSTNQSRID